MTNHIVGVAPSLGANKLLASLPAEDFSRLRPHVQTMSVKNHKVIVTQDDPIQAVYFPTGGAWSLVKNMRNGQIAEVATIGSEGAFGCSLFFGQRIAECDLVVQLPGPPALVMSAERFLAEMNRRGAFFNTIIRYSQALMNQVMQTTACNSLHSVERRCCRWLLMTHDIAAVDDLALTHEVLATMLGVRRPTVTLVIASLQRAGLVEQRRGAVRIVDRTKLEQACCECYDAVKAQWRRLMPTFGTAALAADF